MLDIKNTNGRFLGFELFLISVGVVISFIATGAYGQYQINRGRQGRALDANRMVGSDGLNSSSGVYDPYRLGQKRTQLIVENRTTGLSGFRGRVGYFGVNELNLNLPSSRIDTFNRQSVGLRDVLRGGTYQTKPYFARSTTTLSPRSIVLQESARGVVLPGRGMALPAQKATQRLYKNATQAYQPLMPSGPINAILGQSLSVQPRGQLDRGSIRAQEVERQRAALRGGPGMFSMPHLQDRRKLAEELSEYAQDQLLESKLGEPLGETLGEKFGSQAIEPLGLSKKPKSLTAKFPEGLGKKDEEKIPFRSDVAIRGYVLPGENQDAFLDLLIRLQEKAQTEKAQGIGEKTAADKTREGLIGPGMRTVSLTGDNKIILRSLAGKGGDMFNRYMTRAKKELDANRFYQAAHYYELASITRPTNPLAKLGHCLAKFAAEEWYTSARDLQDAMELFPPLMETQLDLKNLMPMDKLNERLDSLERWVTRIHDKPALVFLAAFMQQNAGNTKQAKKHAEALKKLNLKSLVLNAYVDYIITGKLPAAMKSKKEDKKQKDATPSEAL